MAVTLVAAFGDSGSIVGEDRAACSLGPEPAVALDTVVGRRGGYAVVVWQPKEQDEGSSVVEPAEEWSVKQGAAEIGAPFEEDQIGCIAAAAAGRAVVIDSPACHT